MKQLASEKSAVRKLALLTTVISVFLFSSRILFPRVIGLYGHMSQGLGPGPKLLFHHAFVSCLPQAIFCGVAAFLLHKRGLIKKMSFKPTKHLCLVGLAWGAGIAIISIPILHFLGMPIGVHLNLWSVTGNIFSNTYEEVIFRWFILYGMMAATGNRWAGIAVSAAAFGYVHEQYPLPLRLYIGAIGIALSVLTTKTNNIVAPLIAHDIADWILDILF